MPEIIVGSGFRSKLETLVGRRRDTWLLAAVVGGFVLVGLLLWNREPAAQIAPPAVEAPAAAIVPSPSGEVIYVHVAGAVLRPGLYEVPAGSRVADVVDLAGGAKPQAHINLINLAELLHDGQKVDVPRKGEPAPVPTTMPSSGDAGAPVNVNTADASALETIPGIGPVRAQAIIDERDRSGGFDELQDLLEVDGIGPATLESIRSYITF